MKQDLAELEISMSFEEIEGISKDAFKVIVKKNVKKATLEYLKKLQQTHSKAKNLTYDELDLQLYLKSGTSKMTIKENSFKSSEAQRVQEARGS